MPTSLNNQNNVPVQTGARDLVPGINFGAALRRLTGDTSRGDEDIISGFSKAGGDRSPVGGQIFGRTSVPVDYPYVAGSNDGASDPNGGAYTGASGAYGGGTGSGTADTSAADLAYLDDQEAQLRDILIRTGGTLNNGLTQIGDSYNKEYARTDAKRTAADQGFDTQREDTLNDRSAAVGRVNTGARTLADSVRRMLGMASGTNSTAYQEAAPGMIASDASAKRAGVFDTSGRNLRDIDTADKSTETEFSQYLSDLADQRKQKEMGLRQGIITQEQDVNRNLGEVARQREAIRGGGYGAMRAASAPFQADASAKQAELDSLFERFRTPYQTKDIAPTAPNLADYTVDQTAIKANQNNGVSPDSPYQQFLKKKFNEGTA